MVKIYVAIIQNDTATLIDTWNIFMLLSIKNSTSNTSSLGFIPLDHSLEQAALNLVSSIHGYTLIETNADTIQNKI